MICPGPERPGGRAPTGQAHECGRQGVGDLHRKGPVRWWDVPREWCGGAGPFLLEIETCRPVGYHRTRAALEGGAGDRRARDAFGRDWRSCSAGAGRQDGF